MTIDAESLRPLKDEEALRKMALEQTPEPAKPPALLLSSRSAPAGISAPHPASQAAPSSPPPLLPVSAPVAGRLLTAAAFQRLADVPPKSNGSLTSATRPRGALMRTPCRTSNASPAS